MSNEPNYYEILGIAPTSTPDEIAAAFHGRMLRFRVGQFESRSRALSGPTRADVEQAYAVLSNPQSRALYDAAYFPEQETAPAAAGSRVPRWVWAAAALWLVVIAAICVLGARARFVPSGGPVGQFVNASATAVAQVATSPATPTSTVQSIPTVTIPLAVASPSSTLPAPTPTAPTATATARPPTSTSVPTQTPIPPTPTSIPPTATPAPPPPPPPPPPPTEPPPPTPVPFPATDRIGTRVPVNLRNGPGTGFASLGALPPGTLLAATGESATSGGFFWRRFRLEDGRVGWVRDIDVLPVN